MTARVPHAVVCLFCVFCLSHAGAAFIPSDVPSCHAWFDADALSGVADGATVTNWVDQITGYQAVQTNAAALPTFSSNAINGQAAVVFAGTNSLVTGTVTNGWPTQDATMFVVMKAYNTTQNNRVFSLWPEQNTNRCLAHLPFSAMSTFDFGDFTGAGRIQADPFTGGTNYNIWAMSSESGVGQRLLRNGELEASDADASSITIDGRYLEIGNAVEGEIAELIFFNAALNSRDENSVGYYLQEKYDLAAAYVDPNTLDIGLVGSVLPEQAVAGETIIYTLTASNSGPTNASGLVVTLTGDDVTYVSHAGGTFSTNTGEWTIGTLAYAASTTLTVTVTVDANPFGTVITNSAFVTALNETDWNLANDTAQAAFSLWYDLLDPTDFSHSMTFRFAGYDRDEALVNFPALINLDGAMRQFDYADLAKPDGGDLRFADSDGRKLLLHEIDHWDTNGTSSIWVRMLQLTNNATITAYWGNTNLSTAAWATNGEVWAGGYNLVWHMEQGGTVPRSDSTPNGFDSTTISNSPAAVPGIVGLANDFDGAARYVERSFTPELHPIPFSFSVWTRSRDNNNNRGVVTMYGNTGDGTRGLALEEGSGNNWAFRYGEAPGTAMPYRNPGKVSFGEWDHILVSYDGEQLWSYLNGQLGDVFPLATVATNLGNPLYVGSIAQGSYYHGEIDELRLQSRVRTPNWAYAAYQTVADPAAFVVAETAIRADAATDVTMTTATVNGTLLHDEAETTAVTLYWGTTDGGTTAGAWATAVPLGAQAVGAVSSALSGLSANTTYYYRFAAANTHGTVWAPETRRVRTLFTGNTNGLVLWLSAASLGNLAEGDAVMSWEDASGNGRDMVPYFGAPTFHHNVLNGNPVVRFNSSGLTHNGDGCGFTGSPALTVFMVAKANATSIMRALQIGARRGDNGRELGFGVDASARYNNGNRVFTDSFVGAFGIGMWSRADKMFYDGIRFYKNGVRSGQLSSTNPRNSLNMNDQRITVGMGVSNTGGRNDALDGDIAEIVVYDRLLSADEMDAVGAYLADRYGVTSTYGALDAVDKGDFAHTMTLTFPGYTKAATLTDFPALVVLDETIDGFHYEEFASWTGEDLRFTDADGVTPLRFEIEQWGAAPPPLVYYAFEANALDTSVLGGGHDGTLAGSAAYVTNTVTGKGYCLQLDDASQDHVVLGGFDGVTGQHARTLSCWIRGVENNDTIMSWGLNVAGQKWIMRVNNGATAPAVKGELRVEVNSGYVVGTTLLTDGNWHHVAATFPEDGDNVLDVTLYVDGVEEVRTIQQGQAVNTMSRDVWIGRGHNGNYLTGTIDDLAIWNVELTSTQIADLYNNGVPLDISGGPASTESAVWVRIPSFSPGKRIHAFWGNPDLAGKSSFLNENGGTWSEAYEMVWHLREWDALDSTRQGRDGAASTNTIVGAEGIAGAAQRFDTTGYINYTIDPNITYPRFMLSTWSVADNTNLDINRSTVNTGDTGSDLQFDSNGAGSYRLLADHGNGLFGPLSTEWVYLAAVYEAGSFDLYYNGDYVRSVSAADDTIGRIDVGSNRARDKLFNGVIDEMRLRNDAPSADWIWAVYQNVANQGTFVSFNAAPEGMYLIVR